MPIQPLYNSVCSDMEVLIGDHCVFFPDGKSSVDVKSACVDYLESHGSPISLLPDSGAMFSKSAFLRSIEVRFGSQTSYKTATCNNFNFRPLLKKPQSTMWVKLTMFIHASSWEPLTQKSISSMNVLKQITYVLHLVHTHNFPAYYVDHIITCIFQCCVHQDL